MRRLPHRSARGSEGDLRQHRPGVVPGHEVVGRVAACGTGASGFAVGDRVGVAWLHAACGWCRFCLLARENLCLAPRFTGYDVDGGYADHVVVPAAFAYALPESLDAAVLAPLLCAGIIGYRAYLRSGVRKGQRLGLYGFGASAHIVIQIARSDGCAVYVAIPRRAPSRVAQTSGRDVGGRCTYGTA